MSPIHLFTLAKVPVRLTLSYLLLLAFFGYSASGAGIGFVLVAMFCVTLSLLVHEFGHALVAKRFKLSPHVVLHGFGGLCFHERAARDRDDALIIIAGPAFGLILGLALLGVREALGGYSAPLFRDRLLFVYTFELLIQINIAWSLLNLLPLWPLDGGQLFRLGAIKMSRSPARAERVTHWVGATLGVAGAIVAFAVFNASFAGLLSILLAFENIRRLNAFGAGGAAAPKRNTNADQLLSEATRAMAEGHPREALRLAYQAKDESGLSNAQLDAVWAVLTIASAAAEEYDDAVDYSLRAPRVPPVFAARIKSLVRLGRTAQARRELDADDAPPLSPRLRAEVEALLR